MDHGHSINFCPSCGTPTEMVFSHGDVRPTCPACNWAYFQDPKVAAAALVENDGRVLLVKRIYPPFRGCWGLPAGFVNAYEDPARAAERECEEETGLKVQVDSLMKVITGREHDLGADIILVYTCEVLGGTLQAGDDASEAEFFSRSALPPLAFKTTHTILGVEENTCPQDE
jgi:ADP-ribose pyrophosphatase YjhB (NUDIX family)